MSLKMTHAAESGHYYSSTGEPRYTVTGKNGKERPTTIKDARANGWVPSVTTIIRCAAATGLEQWKIRQAVLSALTHPGLSGTDADVDLIMKDAREQGIKAAERGTIIHAAIQGHYEGRSTAEEFWPHVQGAKKAVNEWHDGQWTAEQSFAHVLGFGGKCDLSSEGFVCDFKTTEKDLSTIKTWDEHSYQLAAYRFGLGMPTARCAIVYVHAITGEARVIELDEDELTRGWRCFAALLQFWKSKNNYRSWAIEKKAAA